MTHLHQDAADLFGVQFLPSRWIGRIRSNPKLVEKILSEIKMLRQEHRITKSCEAAAENLWARWSEKDEFNVAEPSL